MRRRAASNNAAVGWLARLAAEPITLSRERAARPLGIPRDTIHANVLPEIETLTIGDRRLVAVAMVRRHLKDAEEQ
jgi:hypothetical protein